MVRVAGSLQKSNDVMKLVNDSLKLPDMQKTMMEMSKGNEHSWMLREHVHQHHHVDGLTAVLAWLLKCWICMATAAIPFCMISHLARVFIYRVMLQYV